MLKRVSSVDEVRDAVVQLDTKEPPTVVMLDISTTAVSQFFNLSVSLHFLVCYCGGQMCEFTAPRARWAGASLESPVSEEQPVIAEYQIGIHR